MLFLKETTPRIIVKGLFLIFTKTESDNHAIVSTILYQRTISETVLNM